MKSFDIVLLFFFFFAQNIDCMYRFEPSRRVPIIYLSDKNMKTCIPLYTAVSLDKSVGSRGYEFHRHVFVMFCYVYCCEFVTRPVSRPVRLDSIIFWKRKMNHTKILVNVTQIYFQASFASELVSYWAPRDRHRRAAYSLCESSFLIHHGIHHDLFVCPR